MPRNVTLGSITLPQEFVVSPMITQLALKAPNSFILSQKRKVKGKKKKEIQYDIKLKT